MPHFPHTPEALLRRNDSKDANRTCRGITASGRSCRRALASAKSSPMNGAIDASPSPVNAPRAYYCWQHQEQARQGNTEIANNRASNRRTKSDVHGLKTLREQSSIDTLVQKLGISGNETERPKKQNAPARAVRQPMLTSNNNATLDKKTTQSGAVENNTRSSKSKKPASFWSMLCCMSVADDHDNYVEVVRHKRRVEQMQESARPPVVRASFSAPAPMAEARSQQQNEVASYLRPHAPTRQLLSLIPPHLPPSIASSLLTELAKPISPYDEDGYIYIFWLTPQSKERPGPSTAHALLSPSDTRPSNVRRISDVMTEYSFQERDSTKDSQRRDGKQTIVLKIGRASNVTRRMNEWQRQCGYALNLVRWYPHVPSSGSNSNSPKPSPQHRSSEPPFPDLSRPPACRAQSENVLKCPHVHRVERLIHLELAARQVRRQCDACGKEHREWFEVEATQAGVKAVDETIRRWIRWTEGQR